MANQQKYQPLLEKILESLEADKIVKQPGSQSAKFGLEVPTLQSQPLADAGFAPPIPAQEPANIPASAPASEAAQTHEPAEAAGQEHLHQPAEPAPVFQEPPQPAPLPEYFQAPLSEPLSQPLSGISPDQFPENYYEETRIEEAAPAENNHEENPPQQLQPLDPNDQIPALFHRDERNQQSSHNIPITKALYGLTGAIIAGAASVFYILPEPQGDQYLANKYTVAQSANKLFPDNVTSNFAEGGLTPNDQNAISVGVSDESWDKGPGGNLIGNSGQHPLGNQNSLGDKLGNKATPQPKMFASINGPIDQLVSDVVKDLSALGSAKQESFDNKDVVNFDQTSGPAETLNQLESSLENIVNDATSQLSAPAKKIVMAQIVTNSASNPPAPTPAPNNASTDKMRTLTDQVVDALSDLNTAENSNGVSLNQSVDRLRSTLSDLVEEAENQGKGVKRVKHLLEEALGKNKQNLPAALKNKDGSLDISTLIASVVKRSDNNANTSSADAEYLSMIEDEGEKTALSSRILTQKGKGRYLIVKAGDTLSSIAYATYGDAFAYPKIFNANKGVITNANNLKIGTRLTIPN